MAFVERDWRETVGECLLEPYYCYGDRKKESKEKLNNCKWNNEGRQHLTHNKQIDLGMSG